MTSDLPTLPTKYQKLLERLAPLNRVHNGTEMTAAVQILVDFCATHMKGRSVVHTYTPGDRFNHWIVPQHWQVNEFKVTGPDGRTIASSADHPLALSPYSCSADIKLDKAALLRKIVTREDRSTAYSFYFRRMYRHWEQDWNISLPYDLLQQLPDGEYHVKIDVDFTDDPMPVFEHVIEGRTKETVFLAAHLDHPGMVNDSLSGCIASLQIAEALSNADPNYTYRVLLVPEIIGSAVYLKANEALVENTLFALCPNMSAHDAPLAFCKSKSQTSLLDLALGIAVAEAPEPHVVGEFHKYSDCGDEISFDAVGYDIPTSTLSRIGELFSNYHSSDDNLETFLLPDWQARHQRFVETLITAFQYLERNRELVPTFRGNPCLSNPDLDLYLTPSNINNAKIASNTRKSFDGKEIDLRFFMEYFLDALNNKVSILEISDATKLPFDFVYDYALEFAAKNLADLRPVNRRYSAPKVAGTALTRSGTLQS